MGNIYRIGQPWEVGSAIFYEEDSFHVIGPKCDCCMSGYQIERIFPATIYYGGGETRDFRRSPMDSYIATRAIGEELALHFKGVEPKPLYILRSPYSGPWHDKKVRGAHIYKGSELVELWLPHDVPIDLSGRSTLELSGGCEACGRKPIYKIIGMEEEIKGPPRGQEMYTWVRQPRDPEKGLFIPESQLAGNHFFTYGGLWNYCTEDVKKYIEDKGWTGIEFWECGTVVKG